MKKCESETRYYETNTWYHKPKGIYTSILVWKINVHGTVTIDNKGIHSLYPILWFTTGSKLNKKTNTVTILFHCTVKCFKFIEPSSCWIESFQYKMGDLVAQCFLFGFACLLKDLESYNAILVDAQHKLQPSKLSRTVGDIDSNPRYYSMLGMMGIKFYNVTKNRSLYD